MRFVPCVKEDAENTEEHYWENKTMKERPKDHIVGSIFCLMLTAVMVLGMLASLKATTINASAEMLSAPSLAETAAGEIADMTNDQTIDVPVVNPDDLRNEEEESTQVPQVYEGGKDTNRNVTGAKNFQASEEREFAHLEIREEEPEAPAPQQTAQSQQNSQTTTEPQQSPQTQPQTQTSVNTVPETPEANTSVSENTAPETTEPEPVPEEVQTQAPSSGSYGLTYVPCTETGDIEHSATYLQVQSYCSWTGRKLTASAGRIEGPSGQETYYDLDMSVIISIMRDMGYSDPYWVRSDGVKMFGYYVMVAADFSTRPRGTIYETSLGLAIVVDTGGFATSNPRQSDIAVTW